MPRERSHLASAIVLFAAMLAASLCIPVPAFAREYSIPQVDIDAVVAADGSLEVREERTFSFDGAFNGVYFNLPQGEYDGKSVTVDVLEAGEVVGGSYTAFELSDSGDNLTYQIQDYGYSLKLKIFSRHTDEDARFVISYRINNVAMRHADVSELYWQFVTEGWDEESQNVTCTVHLPVPAGQSVVPEDTVRAWGHGPLDASLAFVGDDIVYTVPGVGGSEFAEARITFPESWMPDARQDTKTALPDILAEEQALARAANRKRMAAKAAYYGSMLIAGVTAIGTSVLTFAKRRAYKEATKPQFSGTYFRDVPTSDHPAVLGALYNGGKAGGDEFTATLMELTNSGHIALQHVKKKKSGFFGSTLEDDYRLVYNKPLDDTAASRYKKGSIEASANKINHKAIDLLFKKVALHTSKESHAKGSYPPLYFSSIEEYAKSHASSYESAYDAWETAVERAYANRFVSGEGAVKSPAGTHVACAIADIILAIVFFLAGLLFGMPITLILVFFGLLVAAGVFSIFSAATVAHENAEGREVKAQLKALRNWLKDFTRLEEAIPTDVVLWNRLLVMAVVLGVAEEVIKQLETVLPEVLHSTTLSSTYGWYYVSSSNYMSPARAVSSAVSSAASSAHAVTTASSAGSSWSSGGGGGGGFSGGGGGGFGGGGGGGGGAF